MAEDTDEQVSEKTAKTTDGEGQKESESSAYLKEKTDAFKLYEEALDGADWAYKVKTGTEREIGHKSVVLAEKAYVVAGLYDKESADKMYESATGRPPKPELQKRIEDAKGINPAEGINDLTAGISSLQQKQQLWSLTLDKKTVEQQLSAWEVSIGDTKQRKRQFQRQSTEELLKAERLDGGDATGLGLFIRSIKNGIKAGTDLQMAREQKKKLKELKGNIKEYVSSHGDIVKQIAEFTQEKGQEIASTNGPLGKLMQRFPGAAGIVNKALNKMQGKRDQILNPGEENSPGMTASAKQAFQANMGKDHGMQI